MSKVLLIRMTDAAEVAAIGVPALRHMQSCLGNAELHVLTYGAGAEVIRLASPETALHVLPQGQWSNNIFEAMDAFLGVAETIVSEQFTQIINLDTGFMPCFLARFLKDAGETVSGNVINITVQTLIEGIQQQSLSPDYVLDPKDYMDSSFQGMRRWHTPWWEISTNVWSYPEFYLRQCCGFSPLDYDPIIEVELDSQMLGCAQGKPVVILAIEPNEIQWPDAEHLSLALIQKDIYVEQCSLQGPILKVLSKLRSADLVVATPGAGQWFAQASGTSAVVICGEVDARMLKPDYAVGENGQIPNVRDLADDIENIVKHHAKL